MNRFSVKFIGESGQGVDVVGKMLSNLLKNDNYNVIFYREYPSLIKGGVAFSQVEFSEDKIFGLSDIEDIKVDLINNIIEIDFKHLDRIASPYEMMEDDIQTVSDKIVKLGKDANLKNINMGFLYFVSLCLNISYKNFVTELKLQFKNKPEVLESNLKYIEMMRAEFGRITEDEIVPKSKNILITGNEAIAKGLISAGVSHYFAYPMTPATSIMNFLQEDKNVLVDQTEDEIGAIALSIGANNMGVRSACGTSGGGFDLMTEHISMAMMTEIPIMVILSQRAGTATGQPTHTGQGDLFLSIFAGHGEAPRIVLALSDIDDCYYEIGRAYNLAEKYQVPVIILSDKYLSESHFTAKSFDLSKVKIERYILDKPSSDTKRYSLKTLNGVSPRFVPGNKVAFFDANTDEHDEDGNTTEDSVLAQKMIEKRNKKLDFIIKDLPKYQNFNNFNKIKELNEDIVRKYITWGSSKGYTLDLLEKLAEENIPAEAMNIQYVWPMKKEEIIDFIFDTKSDRKDNLKNVYVVENNYWGQLAELIKWQTGIEIKRENRILRYDGRVIR